MSKSKSIFYLLVTGILLNAVFTYFYQADMKLVYTEDVYGWYFVLSYIGDALLNIASVMAYFVYRRDFPPFVGRLYLVIVGLVILTSLLNVPDVSLLVKPGVFYSIKGAGTWLNFGILFFAADRELMPKLLKVFYYLCLFFVLASLLKLISLGSLSDRDTSLYAIREFAVDLVWIFPFFFLRRDFKGWGKAYQFTTILLVLFFALAIGARSYTLTTGVFILLKVKDRLKSTKGDGVLFLVMIALALGVGYFFLVNSGFYTVYESVLNIFFNRGTQDTRSGQIVEFLGQYDTSNLLFGVGPLATWEWGTRQYAGLDNQMLLTAWWAGVPAAVFYLIYLCRAFFKKVQAVSEEVRVAKIMIGFWILGCFGLAIYATMSCTVYYFFISILIGIIYRNDYSEETDSEENMTT